MSHCGLGLSCEPTPCEHGKYISQEQCHLCELKRQMMALTDMYTELSIRVIAQHDFKLRQIDENRKISRRVDEIDETLKAWNEDFEYLDSLKLNKRIKKLESRKPHKCPVCDGKGYCHSSGINIASGGQCQSCQGKGIVWG